MWKQFISDYLSFSKKQRIGTFVILSLVAFFTTLPFLFPFFIKPKIYDHSSFEKAIDSLKIKQAESLDSFDNRYPNNRNYKKYTPSDASQYESHKPEGELFYFDPNTATSAEWKKLGVRDKTIATIQNYLSKGGKFYKKEDIGKIWGLHQDQVDRLMPYVQIKLNKPIYEVVGKITEKTDFKKTISLVDINLSDTAAFIALPGIGSKLSQRIINFRDKLGGFYAVEQIGETFGLPDSTFQKIKNRLTINATEIRRININQASIDAMKTHPYIRYAIANAIVQYRTQHGNFKAVSDLKKIMTVTEDAFAKMAPYLTVD